MSRPARLPPISFAWYYVVLHAYRGRRLINHAGDLQMLLELLQATFREQGAHLHGGYVDEQEVHLALQVGEVAVSRVIGRFCHTYARRCNRRLGESGVLFRAHPRIVLIQHQRWLVRLVHYIHCVRQLRKPAANDEGPWWSSDAAYRGEGRSWGVVTHAVLHMVAPGSHTHQEQVAAYSARFDRQPTAAQVHAIVHGMAADPRILGDVPFVLNVWRSTGLAASPGNGHSRHASSELALWVTALMERLNRLCAQRLPAEQARRWCMRLTLQALRSRARQRPLPLLRALCVTYLFERQLATCAEAATFFGMRPRAARRRRRRIAAEQFRQWFGGTPEGLLFADGAEPERRRDASVQRTEPQIACRRDEMDVQAFDRLRGRRSGAG